MRPTEAELAAQHRTDDERLTRIVEQTIIDRLRPIGEKLDHALDLIERAKAKAPEA